MEIKKVLLLTVEKLISYRIESQLHEYSSRKEKKG